MAILTKGLCQWNASADFSEINVPLEILGDFKIFTYPFGELQANSITFSTNDLGNKEMSFYITTEKLGEVIGDYPIWDSATGFDSFSYASRLIDFGDQGVELPEELVQYMLSIGEEEKNETINSLYGAVKNKWQWNDVVTLPEDEESELMFILVKINNVLYSMIRLTPDYIIGHAQDFASNE
jgi:hypothetical protein